MSDSLPGSRALPLPNDWGPDGRSAWGQAMAGKCGRIHGRCPPAEVYDSLRGLEAIGNELTLRRALATLVERALNRPEC